MVKSKFKISQNEWIFFCKWLDLFISKFILETYNTLSTGISNFAFTEQKTPAFCTKVLTLQPPPNLLMVLARSNDHRGSKWWNRLWLFPLPHCLSPKGHWIVLFCFQFYLSNIFQSILSFPFLWSKTLLLHYLSFG